MTIEVDARDRHGKPLYLGCPVSVTHCGGDLGRGWIIWNDTFAALQIQMESGSTVGFGLVKHGVERVANEASAARRGIRE